MEIADLRGLQPGDIVENLLTKESYLVTANYGNRVTAVRTVDLTNPSEWRITSKVETRSFPEQNSYQELIHQIEDFPGTDQLVKTLRMETDEPARLEELKKKADDIGINYFELFELNILQERFGESEEGFLKWIEEQKEVGRTAE